MLSDELAVNDINLNNNNYFDSSTISPITSILGSKHEIVNLIYDLSKRHPEYLGKNIESLYYILNAGIGYNSEAYFSMVDGWISSLKNNQDNYIIEWAKAIKSTNRITIFEPIMIRIRDTFLAWHDLEFEKLRPIFYTCSGEFVYDIIPYLIYLLTYLVHGSPFTFDEGQTEASLFGFLSSINIWFKNNLKAIEIEHDVNLDSVESFDKLPKETIQNLFDHMLDPNKIIEIRDSEMNKEPGLLNQSIVTQNGIRDKYIQAYFLEVVNEITKSFFQHGLWNCIFTKLPKYKKDFSINELLLTTEVLISKDRQYIIDNDYFTYKGSFENLEDIILGSQKIGPLNIKSNLIRIDGKPFIDNNQMLRIFIGYLRDEFIHKQSDPLNDSPIYIHETDIKNYYDAISGAFNEFMLKGIYAENNTSLKLFTETIYNLPLSFTRDIDNISKLSSLFKNYNVTSSAILSPYILSFLPKLLLTYCNNTDDLSYFSFPKLIANNLEMFHDDKLRLEKFYNILIAFTYINNKYYQSFVNKTYSYFVEIINDPQTSFIKPYIKGLNDDAEKFSIGGVECYNYAKHSNPFLRGFGFISHCYGTSDKFETVKRYCELISDLSVIESSKSDIVTITNIITNLYNQNDPLVKNVFNRKPNTLSNYKFKQDGSITFTARYPYFLDIATIFKNQTITVIELFLKYSFNRSIPDKIIHRSFYSKPFYIDNNEFKYFKEERNKITLKNKLGKNKSASSELNTVGGMPTSLPLYDFKGQISVENLSYVIPDGLKNIQITLFTSDYNNNDIVWIITNKRKLEVFQNMESTLYDDTDKLKRVQK